MCRRSVPVNYHRRAFKRQCTEDGTWQSGECVAVTCEPPPPIFHGTYKCTNGFQFNSDCWIDCNRANHTVRQHSRCKQVCRALSLFSSFSLLFRRRLSPSPPITVCSTFHSSCAPYQSLLSIAIFLCRPSGCSSTAWLVDWQILHLLCFIRQFHSF